VFELTLACRLTVLHAYASNQSPSGALIEVAQSLYGASTSEAKDNYGRIYKIAPATKHSVGTRLAAAPLMTLQ
jgi:hypothetical protein